MKRSELPDLTRLQTWKVAAYPPDEEVEALDLDTLKREVTEALRDLLPTLNHYIGPNSRTASSMESNVKYRRVQRLVALCDPEYRAGMEWGVRADLKHLRGSGRSEGSDGD